MNILIIGSKGFIGSNCIKYFESTHKVWGCDVINDFTINNYSIVDDLQHTLPELFDQFSFDACVNCSGLAHVPNSLIHPFDDYTQNSVNVIKILEAIRKFSPQCKFINLSSAAVYGNPLTLPIDETHPINPLSPYGYHKYQAELLCEEYHKLYCLKTCSLRIFSAYGPGLKKQILWDLFQKSIASDNIQLFGTGNETRDFIFIDDLVEAIEIVITNGQFMAESINVASGISYKIKEVAEIFFRSMGRKLQINFDDQSREGDPSNWKADIRQIKAIGFKPKTQLTQGIDKYTKWLKELK